MAKTIVTIDDFTHYMNGMLERANHHANGVNLIVHAIAGMVLQYRDISKPIRAMTYEGKTTNVVWVHFNRGCYAFSYDHETDEVIVKEGSTHGPIIHRLDNNTPIAHIDSIIRNL